MLRKWNNVELIRTNVQKIIDSDLFIINELKRSLTHYSVLIINNDNSIINTNIQRQLINIYNNSSINDWKYANKQKLKENNDKVHNDHNN